MFPALRCVTGCSRQRVPTRARNLPKAAGSGKSDDAMPSITETSLSGLRANGIRGPLTSGWRIMAARSIICALDWAFSPHGDTSIGVALTVASVPLWLQLSLMEECHRYVERALPCVGSGSNRDASHELPLYSAPGASLMYKKVPRPRQQRPGQKLLRLP